MFRTNTDSEDGTGLRRVDPFGDKRPVRSSAWSPDGNSIVFAAADKSGVFDLF